MLLEAKSVRERGRKISAETLDSQRVRRGWARGLRELDGRRLEDCDGAAGGDVHEVEFVGRLSGELSQFADGGFVAGDDAAPDESAVGEFFEDVVIAFHSCSFVSWIEKDIGVEIEASCRWVNAC